MKHPYYIVAPRYMRTSAGVRVLYKLCDLINKAGGSAFLYLRPHSNHELAASPMDVAPFLNRKIADYHFQNGLTPIVVYPEVMKISKFDAPVRVRYILNYDNLLFKNDPLEDDDYLLAYSDAIAAQIKVETPLSTIFLPISDPVFYQPPKAPAEARRGGVFYAGKFKYHFSGKTFPITDGMHEITRDRPDSQTPEQLRQLFQTCEFFYCYEDSALAIEAMLCGCPVVFLPNDYFHKTLGAKELAGLGYAWGTDAEQIRHAVATVGQFRERYLTLLSDVQTAVAVFIEQTQILAASKTYDKPFATQMLRGPGRVQKLLDIALFLLEVLQDKGWGGTLKIIYKRLRAGRLKLY
jgi:hypothetical protein